MAVVVDASVAAAWCLRDEEGSARADVVMDRLSDETGVVPGIFWHEIRNVLIVAERRGRIDPDATEHHMNRLRILPLVTDHDQDDARTRPWRAVTHSAATTPRTWRLRNAATRRSRPSTGSWQPRPPRKAS